jgi:phosphoadenosine phosphosulfate reductase
VQNHAASGINGFYNGLAERQGCCAVRKVEPFMRAIKGKKAWVTGVRKEQTAERAKGQPVEWDDRYNMWKISPILDWTEQDIHDMQSGAVLQPTHQASQHGCSPCTRAVEPKNIHAGSVVVENPETRECVCSRNQVIPIKPVKQTVAVKMSSGL